jgi:hypothetical protein
LDSSGAINVTSTLGANLHVINPAGGRWTVIIAFAPTVSGTALSEPFTVSLDQNPPKVTASGVPDGKRISINHPAVVKIKVTNTGTGPEAYFVDGRTDATTQYSLAALTSSQATVPQSVFNSIPAYLVPSQTTAIVGTATSEGPNPIQFDMEGPIGDPDVASGQGLSVAAGVTGNPLTAGEWGLVPDVVGPFGVTGAPSETVDTTLTATTEAFDPAVTSPDTGDLWQVALGGPFTVTPVVVLPGHSATIPVVIAPSGAPGTTVSGVLYLDDNSLNLFGLVPVPNANTIAAIPYSYRIGG